MSCVHNCYSIAVGTSCASVSQGRSRCWLGYRVDCKSQTWSRHWYL